MNEDVYIPVYSAKYKSWRVFHQHTIENHPEELDTLPSVAEFHEYSDALSFANTFDPDARRQAQTGSRKGTDRPGAPAEPVAAGDAVLAETLAALIDMVQTVEYLAPESFDDDEHKQAFEESVARAHRAIQNGKAAAGAKMPADNFITWDCPECDESHDDPPYIQTHCRVCGLVVIAAEPQGISLGKRVPVPQRDQEAPDENVHDG